MPNMGLELKTSGLRVACPTNSANQTPLDFILFFNTSGFLEDINLGINTGLISWYKYKYSFE